MPYTAKDIELATVVDSVNGQTGVVVLDASDVGAEDAGAVAAHALLSDPHPGYILESREGVANGIATLDASGHIPASQLSSLVGGLNYLGTWNATTNTPTIVSGAGTNGDYYRVATSGTTNIDGISEWGASDWIIFNGVAWEKMDNSDAVTSVFGRLGAVVALPGDYSASDVGADPAGTASGLMSSHTSASDPHPGYILESREGVSNGIATLDATGDVPLSQLGNVPAPPVTSVNSQTGVVVLDAGDVGADPSGTASTLITSHTSASDPHPGYILESREGANNGIATLDAGGDVPLSQLGNIPAPPVTSVNGDVGVVVLNAADVGADAAGTASTLVIAHATALDPHTGYVLESREGVASGIATLDVTGNVPLAQLGNVPAVPVTSVNSLTGVVVLNADHINDTSTTHKFTTAAEISKLAGIAPGATANSTDSFLLDRANHTGTQAVGTITGLGALATLSSVDTGQITNQAVTNGKLANVATNTIKGRVSASTGSPEDLSPTQARSVMQVYSSSEVDTAISDAVTLSWDHLVTCWDVAPTLNKVIAGGEVFNYTLGAVIRYRFVPSTYVAAQDSFYSSFNNLTDTLTGLIAQRGF